MNFQADVLELKVDVVRAGLVKRFPGSMIDGRALNQEFARGESMEAVYESATRRLEIASRRSAGGPGISQTPGSGSQAVFTGEHNGIRLGIKERLWSALNWVGRLLGFRSS